MRLSLFLLLFIAVVPSFLGAVHYTWTPELRESYDLALRLRLNDARTKLAALKQSDSDNLLVWYIDNYADFLSVFINENLDEFNQLEKNKRTRLEQLARGPKSSPWRRYTQAGIHLQWALARVKFGEYFTAYNEVRRAFHLLEDNSREFPSFVANRMGLGVLHAVVGSVPENLKWGASLSGMEGSITGGLEELQGVMKYAAKHPEFEFGQEAAVMYAFVLLYLGQQDDQAWAALKDARLDHRQNPLAAFLTASMCIRTGRNDEAISTLLAAPRGEGYHPFAYLDYLLGCAKLYRLDNDAEAYLKRYVNKHPGRHYIKECYRNLAWSRLLQGDQKGYFAYLDLVKSRGYSELDADAKALREAELREVPNLALLKARLLCDGGYFKRANDLLKTKGLQDFSTDRDLIELAYRQGRIYQGLGEAAKALREFDKTIAAGKAKPYYFACNAALQAGILCEKQGLVTKARQYFEQCLEMKPDEYRNSLHQKAKAGINRLKR